jgi:hypothetical protein
VGEILGQEWRDRRMRKRQQSGRIDCALRVIAGSQKDLKHRWRNSCAFVYGGGLEFGRRKPTSVQVRAVLTDRQRRPRGRESWFTIDTSWQIVELVTDSATLEWAVPEDKLEWAMALVQETPSASRFASPECPHPV